MRRPLTIPVFFPNFGAKSAHLIAEKMSRWGQRTDRIYWKITLFLFTNVMSWNRIEFSTKM